MIQLRSLTTALVLGSAALAHSNGILRNGAGARSMGLAGSIVADPGDPLSAMSANPAGLTNESRIALSIGALITIERVAPAMWSYLLGGVG